MPFTDENLPGVALRSRTHVGRIIVRGFFWEQILARRTLAGDARNFLLTWPSVGLSPEILVIFCQVDGLLLIYLSYDAL